MSGISRPLGAHAPRHVPARPTRAFGLVTSVVLAASITAVVLWATSVLVARWG
ncbi:MAG: hypothetical protein OEV62_02685 [Actinomycetota bacterium]|nr:hypothetical protein [Actinomycetota bacterium]MDH5277566.1 hypothetical protein [Actinomycetota bacterium]